MRGTCHGRWIVLALAALVAACSSSGSGQTAAAPQARIGPRASQMGSSGTVVDYDGDGVADLIVGAPYAAGESSIGEVLVYRGTASGFEATPAYTLAGGDNFGSTVVDVGDVDGDGKPDFAVAAVSGDGPDASLCGEVTIFKGGARGQIVARVTGEQALDKFGASVTGRCDLNADGHPDLVVGATHHSPAPELWLGGAYYVHFGPTFSEASRVKLPATATKGILGFSSACGDVNGDGIDDLAVSAIWTHGVVWHESNVLVFYGGAGFSPATDAPDVTIRSTAGHFGDGLAILGDLDGDRRREIAIGVPAFYALPPPTAAMPMPSLKGAVYVVRGGTGSRTVNLSPPRGTPMPPDLLTTLTGDAYLERFGTVVTPLGDLDGDGKPDLAVASPHADAPGATSLDTGRVTGLVRVFLAKDLRTDGAATPASAGRVLSRAERTLHYGQFLAPFQRGGPRLAVGAPTASRQDGTVFVEDLTPPAP